MKLLGAALLLSALAVPATPAAAQPFYGYQTIGKHTFHVSVVWKGAPWVGVGYTLRDYGTSFTDWQVEWRFPVQSIYDLDNHEVIAGFYRPHRVRRRFLAYGLHARFSQSGDATTSVQKLRVAVTALPSYVYTSDLSDGPYGTLGARASYVPTLWQRVTDASSGRAETATLTAHDVELGGHLDVHLQRTLGLSTNVFYTRGWPISGRATDAEPSLWKLLWDANAGTTYYLRR